MIKVTKDQFYKLKFETEHIIKVNQNNISIRQKAHTVLNSLKEIESDFIAVQRLLDDNISSVYIEDYTVGQIRDLMRYVK
ncbi:hypothetical protein QL01_14 [Escherichia phage QL01]|uniref:Exonuclease n=1 Tax=Escherichia phage QL01 TaxID=1673871 RepID=A0A0K1LJH8_9CAUD|nr:hypothetical protein AVT32_gp014 [Escherichia phage QL01]AKU42671.1 hypothetical protein QL01_14 [Escherichia phage QL01]QXV72372.1 hypothetical protein PSD9_87 [Shigella phage PSD9]